MSDLKDKHVVITGANTGIGRATAEELGERGARLTLLGRSAEGATEVLESIRAHGARADFVPCELGDLESVGAAVDELNTRGDPVHVLINNAGVGGQRGQTKSGFELHFGINHLGHFKLTTGLRALLEAGSPSRVVTVSSKAHYNAKGLDLKKVKRFTKTVSGIREYNQSKLANVLFSRELDRRWRGSGVSTYALHPGVIKSDVWRRIPQPFRWLVTRNMKTVAEGAQTTLYCASDGSIADHSGRYWSSSREREASSLARDDDLATRLWEHSERWVNEG